MHGKSRKNIAAFAYPLTHTEPLLSFTPGTAAVYCWRPQSSDADDPEKWKFILPSEVNTEVYVVYCLIPARVPVKPNWTAAVGGKSGRSLFFSPRTKRRKMTTVFFFLFFLSFFYSPDLTVFKVVLDSFSRAELCPMWCQKTQCDFIRNESGCGFLYSLKYCKYYCHVKHDIILQPQLSTPKLQNIEIFNQINHLRINHD